MRSAIFGYGCISDIRKKSQNALTYFSVSRVPVCRRPDLYRTVIVGRMADVRRYNRWGFFGFLLFGQP